MTKNKVATEIFFFYSKLYKFITKAVVEGEQSTVLSVAHGKLRDYLTIATTTFDPFEFRECHLKEAPTNHDLQTLEELSEAAFRDLSAQARNRKVLDLLHLYRELSGTQGMEDLYLRIINTRHLEEDENGAAVVTIVVHNLCALMDLFEEGSDTISHVHLSEKG